MAEKGKIGPAPFNNTVRHFCHRRQRRRLFVNSSFQFIITLILCAALAGALYGFSTYITGMTDPIKKGFNALITGLSILLGLNLASSLKSYAQMMRWRFLASEYRTLQDFELVMQCESQEKVFRLLWAGRTRGQWWPNTVQVLAFFWILVNVALQIVTALLGLTYSINISDTHTHLINNANVSVAYLTTIEPQISSDFEFNDESSYTQNLGVSAEGYSVYIQDINDSNPSAYEEA